MRVPRQGNDDKMYCRGNRHIACGQQNRLRCDWRILCDIGRQNCHEENRRLWVKQVQQKSVAKPSREYVVVGCVSRDIIPAYPSAPRQPQKIRNACISQQVEYRRRSGRQFRQPDRRRGSQCRQAKRNPGDRCKASPFALACTRQRQPRHIWARRQLNEQSCEEEGNI